MKSIGKWTPTMMIYPKNHLVSSSFADAEPFFPSYSKDPPDMQLIMSNSYAKKWFQEKTVHKKKMLEIKAENEVFLMRRYVVRGLAKKMKELELRRRAPSRIKIGKKVPFAVRLLPPGENAPKTSATKSQEQTLKPKPATALKHLVEMNSTSHHKVDFEVLNRKLEEFAKTSPHLHAEQVGKNLKLYRVYCRKNHHHGCDCEI